MRASAIDASCRALLVVGPASTAASLTVIVEAAIAVFRACGIGDAGVIPASIFAYFLVPPRTATAGLEDIVRAAIPAILARGGSAVDHVARDELELAALDDADGGQQQDDEQEYRENEGAGQLGAAIYTAAVQLAIGTVRHTVIF